MERLMPNLVRRTAESFPIGSYLFAGGLDGRGMYRITRVVPEKLEVYGVLVEAEPLSKPWWRFNSDEGLPTALPQDEWRPIPEQKKKAKSKKKGDHA